MTNREKYEQQQHEERIRQYQEWLLEFLHIEMEERQERERKMLESFHEYHGSTVVAEDALLCPGDILVLEPGDNMLISSRGVSITLNNGDLEKLLDTDTITKLCDTQSTSDKDFKKTLDNITSKIDEQAYYRDAYMYCETDADYAIAMFAKDAKSMMPTGLIIRNGMEFATAAGDAIGADTMDALTKGILSNDAEAPVKECSYNEFNPENKNIKEELQENINPERENKNLKYEQMKELYQQKNYDAEISDSQIDNAGSNFERLNMVKTRQVQNEQKISDIESENDAISPLSTSKAMRYMS